MSEGRSRGRGLEEVQRDEGVVRERAKVPGFGGGQGDEEGEQGDRVG